MKGGVFFLVVGGTKEMFEKSYSKVSILNQSNLNQCINTSRPIANALIDLLRIIASRQQKRTCWIIGSSHTIQCIQYLLYLRGFRHKQFNILNPHNLRNT